MARPVETNVLIVEVTDPDDSSMKLSNELRSHGVLANPWEARTIRMVTHLDLSDDDIARTCAVLKQLRG